MKIKDLFSYLRYPKFLALILTVFLAYFLFIERNFEPWHDFLISLGYVGIFIVGMLYVYGFTAAPATVILLILAKGQNIILAGLVAGLGALVSDLILFKFIRHSFIDEIERLAQQRIFVYLKSKMSLLVQKYFLPILGAVLVASPLPDEIGVSLLASSGISNRNFYLLSYVLNTAGIFVILFIGSRL
ncbi:MAG: hypothetical protein WC480_00920 [Patescibacteria group bacterium]